MDTKLSCLCVMERERERERERKREGWELMCTVLSQTYTQDKPPTACKGALVCATQPLANYCSNQVGQIVQLLIRTNYTDTCKK